MPEAPSGTQLAQRNPMVLHERGGGAPGEGSARAPPLAHPQARPPGRGSGQARLYGSKIEAMRTEIAAWLQSSQMFSGSVEDHYWLTRNTKAGPNERRTAATAATLSQKRKAGSIGEGSGSPC